MRASLVGLKDSHFHCRGHRFALCLVKFHMPHGVGKKKKVINKKQGANFMKRE